MLQTVAQVTMWITSEMAALDANVQGTQKQYELWDPGEATRSEKLKQVARVGSRCSHPGEKPHWVELYKQNTGGMLCLVLLFLPGLCCRCTFGTARFTGMVQRRGLQRNSGAGKCAGKLGKWNGRGTFQLLKVPSAGRRLELL